MNIFALYLLLVACALAAAKQRVQSANHFHPHGKHLQAFGLPEHVAELRSVSSSSASASKTGKARREEEMLLKKPLVSLKSPDELLEKDPFRKRFAEIAEKRMQSHEEVAKTIKLQEFPSTSTSASSSNVGHDGWLFSSASDTCFSNSPILWAASLLSNCVRDGNNSYSLSNCVPGKHFTRIEYSDDSCTNMTGTKIIPMPDICYYDEILMTNMSVTCVNMTQPGELYPPQVTGEYMTISTYKNDFTCSETAIELEAYSHECIPSNFTESDDDYLPVLSTRYGRPGPGQLSLFQFSDYNCTEFITGFTSPEVSCKNAFDDYYYSYDDYYASQHVNETLTVFWTNYNNGGNDNYDDFSMPPQLVFVSFFDSYDICPNEVPSLTVGYTDYACLAAYDINGKPLNMSLNIQSGDTKVELYYYNHTMYCDSDETSYSTIELYQCLPTANTGMSNLGAAYTVFTAFSDAVLVDGTVGISGYRTYDDFKMNATDACSTDYLDMLYIYPVSTCLADPSGKGYFSLSCNATSGEINEIRFADEFCLFPSNFTSFQNTCMNVTSEEFVEISATLDLTQFTYFPNVDLNPPGQGKHTGGGGGEQALRKVETPKKSGESRKTSNRKMLSQMSVSAKLAMAKIRESALVATTTTEAVDINSFAATDDAAPTTFFYQNLYSGDCSGEPILIEAAPAGTCLMSAGGSEKFLCSAGQVVVKSYSDSDCQNYVTSSTYALDNVCSNTYIYGVQYPSKFGCGTLDFEGYVLEASFDVDDDDDYPCHDLDPEVVKVAAYKQGVCFAAGPSSFAFACEQSTLTGGEVRLYTYIDSQICNSTIIDRDIITTSCSNNNNMYLDPDDVINDVTINSEVWTCVPKPPASSQYLYNYVSFTCPVPSDDYYYYYYDDDSSAAAAVKLSVGAIVGIAVGGFLGVSILAGAAYFAFLKFSVTGAKTASTLASKAAAADKGVIEIDVNPMFSGNGQSHLSTL